VEYSLTAAKGDKQFKRALELGSRLTARCVQKDGTIRCVVKDLASRKEMDVPLAEVGKEIARAVRQTPT
jgi:hypothetical protein